MNDPALVGIPWKRNAVHIDHGVARCRKDSDLRFLALHHEVGIAASKSFSRQSAPLVYRGLLPNLHRAIRQSDGLACRRLYRLTGHDLRFERIRMHDRAPVMAYGA